MFGDPKLSFSRFSIFDPCRDPWDLKVSGSTNHKPPLWSNHALRCRLTFSMYRILSRYTPESCHRWEGGRGGRTKMEQFVLPQ